MSKFHGWRMVTAGGGLQFLQAGLMQQAFGAYVAVLSVERGWSKTALSGAASLQSVETAIIGPLLGWLCDRFGPHRLIRVGIVVFGIGLMLLGLVDSLAGLYGAVAVVALGTSLAGYFPINIAIVHWFERKRARALSATALGLALGGLFVPVVALSIVEFGWRATAIASGVFAILVGVPFARQFRGRPEDLGQTIDGLPGPAVPSAPVAAATVPVEAEPDVAAPRAVPVPAVEHYRTGVKYIHAYYDYHAIRALRRQGQLGLLAAAASWLGAQEAIFNWTDPMPAIADTARHWKARQRGKVSRPQSA